MSNQPFIRQVELLIGPLEEWRGGGNQDLALRIFSDGSNDGLRIRFAVRKHIISTASPTVISVYNLGPKLRASLQKSNAQIVLRAGWANTGLTTIFSGSLLACVHQREGADIVTQLISLSGFGGCARTTIAGTFTEGASITEIVTGFAGVIPGVKVDPKLIQISEHFVGSQGMSFPPIPVAEALDKLARVYGFSWWIDKGYFHALDDEQSISGGEVFLSTNNGFLFRVEPMLVSPMQVKAGVSVHSLFNPGIEAGKTVRIESTVNPQLNGSYKVHTLSHSGDTHGSQWDTHVESWVGSKWILEHLIK